MNYCKTCNHPIRTVKYGVVIEKTGNHPWGKYMAYWESGSLSVHYADTEEQALENVMNELDRVLK